MAEGAVEEGGEEEERKGMRKCHSVIFSGLDCTTNFLNNYLSILAWSEEVECYILGINDWVANTIKEMLFTLNPFFKSIFRLKIKLYRFCVVDATRWFLLKLESNTTS